MELVDFNPPKRFSVKLKDVETEVPYGVYVAKRCSGYEAKAIKGSRFKMPFDVYEVQTDQNHYTFEMKPNSDFLYNYFGC